MVTGETLLRMRRALPGLAAFKGQCFKAVLACLLLCCFALAAPQIAAAQQKKPGLSGVLTAPTVGANEPMLLQADEMIYDNDNNRITAKGNVEIYYGNYTLLAQQVIYDRSTNTLKAEGNVSIKDPDGAVITSDQITLTDDFRDGFIDTLKVVTQEDTRIVAATASREAGNVTVFQDGWFTPCKPCLRNPEKAPTWRIRAQKITHRRDQATITYKNAVFDFLGVPVAWVPYFQMADPTVKRKSGFLMPTYGNSDQLGSTFQVPYYFALSDNYDFTFAPMVTTNAGTLLQGNWRHRLSNGGYYIDLAGVVDDADNLASPADGDFRGSIKTAGKFALNPYWGWGWDILAETDDTFRRFYSLDSRLKTDRVSQVFLEGLHDRNYMSTRFYETGNLLLTDEPSAQAWVLPVVDYDYIVSQPIMGGEMSFNANAMSLTSGQEGPNSSRVIAQAQWRRQMIDGVGQVYTPFAQLRGDVYNVSDFTAADTTSPLGDNIAPTPTRSVDPNSNPVRGNAVAGAEYRYPFVANTGNVTHIMEPVGQIIARPNEVGNQGEIPNEDAISLVFDDTILFDIDKFSGYDRMETGTRANVGLRYTAQLYSGAYARAVFGESYQLAGENSFNDQTGAGLETARSDYVGGLYVQANTNLSFVAQSRWDQDNFATQRTDLGSNVNYGPVTVGVNYAKAVAQPGLEQQGLSVDEGREEIRTTGALALTERWALLGQIRYDLQNDYTLTDAVGLRYQDDCFMMSVQYAESFVKDRDIEPEQIVLVNFSLKYLGAYSLQSEVMGMVGPDSSDLNNP